MFEVQTCGMISPDVSVLISSHLLCNFYCTMMFWDLFFFSSSLFLFSSLNALLHALYFISFFKQVLYFILLSLLLLYTDHLRIRYYIILFSHCWLQHFSLLSVFVSLPVLTILFVYTTLYYIPVVSYSSFGFSFYPFLPDLYNYILYLTSHYTFSRLE